jgi:hypothetical protein
MDGYNFLSLIPFWIQLLAPAAISTKSRRFGRDLPSAIKNCRDISSTHFPQMDPSLTRQGDIGRIAGRVVNQTECVVQGSYSVEDGVFLVSCSGHVFTF